MARIQGVEPYQAGLFTRFVYRLVRRKLAQLTGRACVPESIKITAHHPRLFRATGQMELGQAAARTAPDALKTLASVKAATLIGCPY